MAKTPPEDQNTLHVALARDCDAFFNAVVLSASDFVVPVQAGDQGQGDAVRIRSLDGSFEQVVALGPKNDKQLEAPDSNGISRVWFRTVRFGAYRFGVRVAGRWYDIIGNLVFRKDGALVGDQAAPEQRPAIHAPPPQTVPPPPAACFDLGALYQEPPMCLPDQTDFGE